MKISKEKNQHETPKGSPWNPRAIRIVFFGSSTFSLPSLKMLLAEGYTLPLIVTHPPRKGSRGAVQETPVATFAKELQLPLYQPERLEKEAITTLQKAQPDVQVVVAYGKILPREVLEIPGLGTLNLHPSLLPRYRGPSPLQNALLYGEKETGITVMLLDEGMDTGDILLQKTLPLFPHERYRELAERCAKEGAMLLQKALRLWIERKIEPIPQDESCATLCEIIEREDGRIFWNATVKEIYNRYRAFYPWPGIFTFWRRGKNLVRLKLLEVQPFEDLTEQEQQLPYGHVFRPSRAPEECAIKASQGALIVKQLQEEGKKPLSCEAFLRGHQDFIGSTLVS